MIYEHICMKMKLTTELFLHFTDKVLCITLFGLGFYLIAYGEVIQKFQLKRTNFAVYTERITELPTILTGMSGDIMDLEFGRDYGMFYGAASASMFYELLNMQSVNLSEGHNSVPGSNLTVALEQAGINNFLITPINFQPVMKVDYLLAYIFFNASSLSNKSLEVEILLTVKNNTIHTCEGVHADGTVQKRSVPLGQHFDGTVSMEKYYYHRGCRTKPYFDELADILEKSLMKKCGQLCKPVALPFWCGLGATDFMRNISLCQDKRVQKCTEDQIVEAGRKVLAKPCTKVQYRLQGKEFGIPAYLEKYLLQGSESKLSKLKGLSIFSLKFAKPNELRVYDEYLIYDFVEMISAIGGTMGLCIGFSFLDFTRTLLKFFIQIIGSIKKQRKKDEVNIGETIQVKEIESSNL